MTRIRTASLGLQKTHARMTRLCAARKLISPYTRPVSTIGEFMVSALAWEHDQRTPMTEVLTSVDRASVAMLKGVMPSREAIRRVAQDAAVGPEKVL